MALAAREAGIQTLFVPAENAAEATLAGGLTVYGVPDVAALTAHLKGEASSPPLPYGSPRRTGLPCRICRTSWAGKRKTRPGD